MIQREFREWRAKRNNWDSRQRPRVGGAFYPIEMIAALINTLAIRPVMAIIMPFVAKNRKKMINRRVTAWDGVILDGELWDWKDCWIG